jgi:hypothetical protein
MRTVVQASSGEERMVAKKFGSGLANNVSRREVRNKSRSFQGGIFSMAELAGQCRKGFGTGDHDGP